jgi:hypothetical protein
MACNNTAIRQGQFSGWFVDTCSGSIGPLETEQEARDLLALLVIADAARDEFGCAEAECAG